MIAPCVCPRMKVEEWWGGAPHLQYPVLRVHACMAQSCLVCSVPLDAQSPNRLRALVFRYAPWAAAFLFALPVSIISWQCVHSMTDPHILLRQLAALNVSTVEHLGLVQNGKPQRKHGDQCMDQYPQPMHLVSGMSLVSPVITLRIVALRLGRPCLLYTSPSPRDGLLSRMPSSA